MHCTILVCKDSFNSADISIQTEKKSDERKKNFRVEKQICAFNYTTNQIWMSQYSTCSSKKYEPPSVYKWIGFN